MKKITFCLMTTGLLLTFHPAQSSSVTRESVSFTADSKSTEAAQARTLLLRLNEINQMDRSNLKSSDRKNLRGEVLSIRHRLDGLGGGVYLSAGALILIIILLVILL